MSRSSTADPARRSLMRLRWGLRAAVLLGLLLVELCYLVALHRSWGEIALDLLLGALLGLGLVELGFFLVFRLQRQATVDRQQLASFSGHLQELYGVRQQLVASLYDGAVPDPALNRDALYNALQHLVDLCTAQRASLLLLDDTEQPQDLIHIGLPADAKSGAKPVSLSPTDPPTITDVSAPWLAFLMPGLRAEEVHSFLAVPLAARERLYGYLSLADARSLSSREQSLLTSFAADLGMILDNAALFRTTQQRLSKAAALSEISQVISAKLTQDDLLPFLVENLTRTLNASTCLLFLFHPYTNELELAASFGAQEDLHTSPFFGGYLSVSRSVIEKKNPAVIRDLSAVPGVTGPLSTPLPEKSLLALPLLVKGKPMGAVLIGETRRQRQFTESDVGRAMVVVNQGATAIANARLFQEVERRVVELGTLAEISRVIFAPPHFHDIHQRVVDELARAFGYPFAAFYQVGEHGLELRAQTGYGDQNPSTHIPLGSGPIGEAAATGEISYIPASRGSTKEIASQIAIPLGKDGHVVGVLSVESFEPLTEVDLSLLQSLSFQVSTALENARLYTAEQREREVTRTLLQIAGDLSGTLQLQEVLNLILERLHAVLPYDSAAIGLLSGDIYQVAAVHRRSDAESLWGSVLPVSDLPLVARVLNERTAVIVPDTQESNDWVAPKNNPGIRSWLGVPLAVQDRTIGLLMLNHGKPAFYDQESVRLAVAFAQHAALAIDNARLYEQTQAKLREQTFLYEMTSAIASTLDAGQVLRFLTERLVTVLSVTSAGVSTLTNEMQTAALVTWHWSADADPAERDAELGAVYEMADFPATAAGLMQRQPLVVTPGAPPEWSRRMQERAGQTLLVLPLVARDRVTGFVELWDSRSRRRFTEAEIALAQTLINQAAVAVDNARLFAESQRGISEMMLLYDIAVAAASSMELDTILQTVVKTLQFRVLERSMVSIWLLNPSENAVQLRAIAGEIEGIDHDAPPNRELRDKVVRTGQAILISDTHRDMSYVDSSSTIGSIMCIPLAWSQRTSGVLQALSAQQNAFSNHDFRLLRTMAGSLAIAIENIRLFDELKHSEEALTLRNQALKRANDRLQELDRLKSAFIASVSHELRTPLNSIIGFSEVLLDGLGGEIAPLTHEYLGYIHTSGKHLLALINDILDLSKIQAGRMVLSLDQVDIAEVIEEVLATVAPAASKKKQQLCIDRKSPLSPLIADRFRLKQVLINLVGNAVKFTQAGGHITVRATMTNETTLRLDVVDDGPGISLEDQIMIFEEFRQARSTQPGEGTGLGLAISRRLVELHSGRIWVESELGKGATFTVLLPIAGPELDDLSQRDGE
jgi:GAF domain-containing protein